MSDFTRLSGIEPLYQYDLDPKIDKAKAREAAHIEMARLRKEKEHQSVLDDRMKIMSGLKKPDQAGLVNAEDEPEQAEENLDMAGPVDPEDMAFANLEARKMTKAQSVAAKQAFVRQAHAKRYQRGHSFDREEYPPIKGMEGPFSMKLKGGQRGVVYYDSKAGKYYDRKTDMYVQVEALEGIQRIAKFNESGDDRYEIVVNGKLYGTSKKPAMAIVTAKRKKGSVQVVDSKTGNIVYDSEIRTKPDARRLKKKISAIQKLRLNRSATDAKMKKEKK